MWTKGLTLWRFTLCTLLAASALAAVARGDEDIPSESQCRPYIEKALKELESGDAEHDSAEKNDSSEVSVNDETNEVSSAENGGEATDSADSKEDESPLLEVADEPYVSQASLEELAAEDNISKEDTTQDDAEGESAEKEAENESQQDDGDSKEETASAEEQTAEQDSVEAQDESEANSKEDSKENADEESKETEAAAADEDSSKEAVDDSKSEETADESEQTEDKSNVEDDGSQEKADESQEDKEEITDDGSQEGKDESKEEDTETQSAEEEKADSREDTNEDSGEVKDETAEDQKESDEEKEKSDEDQSAEEGVTEDQAESDEEKNETGEEKDASEEKDTSGEEKEKASGETDASAEETTEAEGGVEDKSEEASEQADSKEDEGEGAKSEETGSEDSEEPAAEASEEAAAEGSEEAAVEGSEEAAVEGAEDSGSEETAAEGSEEAAAEGSEEAATEGSDETAAEGSEEPTEEESSQEDKDSAPEEELLFTIEIPDNLRSREHINQILRLEEEASEDELTVDRSADIILRDVKRTYENSIKPLETLYKYRDLSNRHFGDPEIFSKPLVLFMGPWSGGKSSILNYLTGLEFTEWSLRTGAEPSPAYFNILMHGNEPQVLDGTQLAADWTFSGLQKFGQGLEERLRGLRYPSKILEKVNIVEIPGILEVRKQVSRVFPFNDACQWFIDRADIIFLVYDPSKLDVGPETEAILDQLKGRESQTRIVLNKADTVKPEELMRVQSALIWNISPLMSSAQPPMMYTVSLWSMPFEAGAPVRLLQAQERELLKDLRQAVDKRIENKIASARRFAVRVRNHAKMVDCYLTTYYNHKTIFGNRKLIADAIIENPQNYHIYEGLSTLTNISRYDLPDPETYRDFFRLNPLYEFQQLSATCTYFRGCPITRLDVAIAYDLPELVGKYKKMVETATPQGMPKS